MIKTVSAHKAYYWGTLSVVTALLFVMFTLHPALIDDIRFREPLSAFLADGTAASFFDNWQSSVVECLRVDNGRIPQLLATVLVVLPRWAVAIVLSLSVWLCVMFSARIAGVWQRHPFLFALMVFLWVFCMPWADFMFTVMFAANYLPTGAVMLFALWLFVNRKLKVWSAVALGLVAGAGHEMYCAAMIAGVAVLCVLHKEYRTKESLAFMASLGAALLYLFMMPGTSVRSGLLDIFGGFVNLRASLYMGILFYAYIVMLVAVLAINRYRRATDWKVQQLCVTCAIVGWAVWRMFMSGQRLVWCLDIFSVTGIVSLLSSVRYPLLKRKVAYAAGIVLCLTATVHLALCLPLFALMHREVEEVRSLTPDDKGNVYYDLTTPADAPVYLLGKPNFNIYSLSWYGLRYVLPRRLQSFRAGDGSLIGTQSEVYCVDGLLVVPCVGPSTHNAVTLKSDYGDYETESEAGVRRFTGADGCDYLYISPYYRSLRAAEREPVSVDVVFP
ncbi:MAG: hypothetical protein K2F78_08435 [Muribaculaceae bacterium]|nr:hypothetical protein [Muribaculaceae bacterium]